MWWGGGGGLKVLRHWKCWLLFNRLGELRVTEGDWKNEAAFTKQLRVIHQMPVLIIVVGTAWKRVLYLGFLFLLVALRAKDSSGLSLIPHLCDGGPVLTLRSKVILWPVLPWPVHCAGLPSFRRSVSVLQYKYLCGHRDSPGEVR